jgi:hypothetical protein
MDLFGVYYSHVERLLDTRLVKEQFPAAVNIQHTVGKQPVFKILRAPNEESLSAFLHRVRMLILTNEPASYDKVTGLIKRHISEPAVLAFFDAQRPQRI